MERKEIKDKLALNLDRGLNKNGRAWVIDEPEPCSAQFSQLAYV